MGRQSYLKQIRRTARLHLAQGTTPLGATEPTSPRSIRRSLAIAAGVEPVALPGDHREAKAIARNRF